MYGDGVVVMIVKYMGMGGLEKNSWGWGGNGADFHYSLILFTTLTTACRLWLFQHLFAQQQ